MIEKATKNTSCQILSTFLMVLTRMQNRRKGNKVQQEIKERERTAKKIANHAANLIEMRNLAIIHTAIIQGDIAVLMTPTELK